MPIAFVLVFDEKSTSQLTHLSKSFIKENITSLEPKVRPHITLNVYSYIDTEIAKKRLIQICNQFEPFKIQFSSIGYFPSEESVIFLNPKTSFKLLTIQHRVFELFNDFKAESTPEDWNPHCTLVTYVSSEKLPKAIDIIKKGIIMTMDQPFYAIANAIDVIDFERKPLKINSINKFNLKGDVNK